MKAAGVLSLIVLTILSGCKSTGKEPEGYRVTSYDGATHEWTIIRTGTFDGKFQRKRLVLICTFYVWGGQRPVSGPEACHLTVGQLIVPHISISDNDRQPNVDVTELPDETLAIMEGKGTDRTSQHFQILKYELLPDSEN